MEKLRAAIMGKKGKNLDDLQYMSGKCSQKRIEYHKIFRVLSYRRFGVTKCPPPEICQEDPGIQVSTNISFKGTYQAKCVRHMGGKHSGHYKCDPPPPIC